MDRGRGRRAGSASSGPVHFGVAAAWEGTADKTGRGRPVTVGRGGSDRAGQSESLKQEPGGRGRARAGGGKGCRGPSRF